MRTKKINTLLLCIGLFTMLFSACNEKKEPVGKEPEVVLTVAGSFEECTAIDAVAREFTKKYNNCTIQYEYLQNYTESIPKRMTGDARVDIFFCTNLQASSAMTPHALELNSCEGFDQSNLFEGLVENFSFRDGTDNKTKLYAVPLGAEMRGMYVNKTLLDSLHIEVPKDQATFLAACEKLKEKGYIPCHGNPAGFGHMLVYPWICNSIANAENKQETYDMVNNKEPGFEKLFADPCAFLYHLVEQSYYDYKTAQTELDLFNDVTEDAYARYFLNIKKVGEEYEKVDDVGQIAFMPSAMSIMSVLKKTKEDYHSHIEYVFLPAPVGAEGGFVYMSPAHGIAINKDSLQLQWSVRFLDFLFQKEINELFAKNFSIIPNTKEAFAYVSTLYDIPERQISQLGDVTFRWDFYDAVSKTLMDISKGNNPKYMQQLEDGTVALYPLEYYLSSLKERMETNE